MDSARFYGKKLKPGIVEWTARQLLELKPEVAIGLLDIWVHHKRHMEATHETLQELNSLMDDSFIKALHELKQPKKYIQGINGNQMDVNLVATTIDDKRNFSI